MLVILLGMVLSLGNTVAGSTFNLTVPHSPIPVQLGSSATLPCQLNPPLNAAQFQVRWYRNDDVDNHVILYENQMIQDTSTDPHYRGRASLMGNLEKGDVSLKLENLTLADRGEYKCFVKSAAWYERASVSLSMKVVGLIPVLSYTEVGKDQMNVTCVSDGWSPNPTLIWRDKQGREITDIPVCEYTTDADRLVSVTSWLLVTPSDSDWISCSVYLSDQEMRESKVLPQITRTQTNAVTPANSSGESGKWRAAFITLLVLVLLEFPLLFLLYRKGYINIGKQTETDLVDGLHDKRPQCIGEEIIPLQRMFVFYTTLKH